MVVEVVRSLVDQGLAVPRLVVRAPPEGTRRRGVTRVVVHQRAVARQQAVRQAAVLLPSGGRPREGAPPKGLTVRRGIPTV